MNLPSPDSLLNAYVTLFVVADPLGNAPLFLTLTAGLQASVRRSIAIRASTISFFVLALFAITGTAVLDAIGITVDAFRIAGGLLLFATAFEMIHGTRQERREDTTHDAANRAADIAVFPLAIPLIAGPGTISATVLLSSEFAAADTGHAGGWIGIASLLAVILALMITTAVVLIASERLDRHLGRTGKLVLTRLFGILLAALSVQYIADGVLAIGRGG